MKSYAIKVSLQYRGYKKCSWAGISQASTRKKAIEQVKEMIIEMVNQQPGISAKVSDVKVTECRLFKDFVITEKTQE